jgi:hypothetical protein
MAASLAGGGLGAFGSIMQGNAAAGAARYNAQMSSDQAVAAGAALDVNAQQTYRQGDLLQGRARATEAANGVDVNSGTARQVQTDIGERTGQDVARQEYNTQLAQWGALNQQQLDMTSAKYDTEAGELSAGGSAFNTASQVSSKWSSYQTQGIFGGSGTSALPNGAVINAGSGVGAGWGASPLNVNWAAGWEA